ncbi:hypothetical protein HI914_06680 [Erysiphe necator]|nr:hypothetical protein HI914_06680 [Erysiphe necator]
MARLALENLKSTIIQFAASDANSKPYTPQLREVNKSASVAVPRIFSTTNSGCKVQNSTNPSLPLRPIANESSWLTVVRNGFNKTRTATTPVSQQTIPTQPRSSGHQPNYCLVNNERLFIRLKNEHEWRKLSSAGIREIIVNKSYISPSAIGTINPVRSGFALSPCTNEGQEELLNAVTRLSLIGARLEAATNWTSVLIPKVPKSRHTLNGHIEVRKNCSR